MIYQRISKKFLKITRVERFTLNTTLFNSSKISIRTSQNHTTLENSTWKSYRTSKSMKIVDSFFIKYSMESHSSSSIVFSYEKFCEYMVLCGKFYILFVFYYCKESSKSMLKFPRNVNTFEYKCELSFMPLNILGFFSITVLLQK